ncbi:ATP-binding protein [Candidatus Poribacteria bacterium]|nr:ATP-binding protein [Candidatus Poribacteria bacterium]
MFIDRINELSYLESEYSKPHANLIVIYGRRRVGKTTLIQEFVRNKPKLYFLADQQLESEQIKRFQEALGHLLLDPLLEQIELPTWDACFQYLLRSWSSERKLVLVLDEFQYLAKINQAFPSILQRLWDEHLKNQNICLILCGSLVSMMYQTTLSYQSPLYGRRSGQIKLQPLSFVDYRHFFPTLSFEECVEFYSVTGGVPKYIEVFDANADLFTKIAQQILNKNSLLYYEPRLLLNEEVIESTTYFSILSVIAQGYNKIGNIAGRLGVKVNNLGKYLTTLIELGLLERRVPITEKDPSKSKKGLYFIKDNFFRFWFRYVFPYQNYLEMDNLAYVQEKLQSTFSEYVSLTFESCCAELMWNWAAHNQLPFPLEKIGRWWNKNAEIDIVGINETTRQIIFGECKWTAQPMGVDDFQSLQAKTAFVDWDFDEQNVAYILFSKSGFTPQLVANARAANVPVLLHGIDKEIED